MDLLIPRRRTARPRGEQGYALLLMLLTVAMMIIAAGVIVPSITFDLKRDREEEMIHRGVQYSRAIRLYYKKFGRYPAKIQDLENTNQLRFLRKRYKDPLTGKDFKLLHFGEVKLAGSLGMGIGIGQGAGNANSGPGGLGQNSAFGGNSAFGTNNSFGSSNGFGSNSGFGNSSFGSNSNSAFGQNQATQSQPGPSSAGDVTQAGSDTGTQSGTDAGQSGSQTSATGSNTNGPGNNPGVTGDRLTNTTFGGGAIIGVASDSKDPTIRLYNKKKKYNEWVFVYDPSQDRGFLIMTPYQPQLMQFGLQGVQNLNGQNGAGQNGTGFGNNGLNNGGFNNGGFGNSFGIQPGGMQNNNNQNQNSGFGSPNQPNNPQQQ